jgi:hypothetical protein
MNKYPSQQSMLMTILLLLLFFSIKFLCGIEDDFLQTNYDWNNIKIVKNIGKVKVDSLSYNYINIENPQNIRFDINNSFKLTDINNNNYFFRATTLINKNHKLYFSGLKWLVDIPSIKTHVFSMEEIEIPFAKKGTNSIITIGDVLFFLNESKYFRQNLFNRSDVFFKGKNRDVYNHLYLAKANYNADSILKLTQNIQPANYYILFFKDANMQVKQLKQINENLLKNKPKKIFWIIPPSVLDNNHSVKTKINKIAGKNISIIDTDSLLLNKNEMFYKSNQQILSKKVYITLSNKIAEIINDKRN